MSRSGAGASSVFPLFLPLSVRLRRSSASGRDARRRSVRRPGRSIAGGRHATRLPVWIFALQAGLVCAQAGLGSITPAWPSAPAAGMCAPAGGAPAAADLPWSLSGSIGPGVGGRDVEAFVAALEGTAREPRPAPDVCNAPAPANAEPASVAEGTIGRAAGNPVDVVTGNKYLRRIDVVLPHPQSSSLSPAGIAVAFGLPRDDTLNLLFARHYNSRSDFSLSLGRGWSHSFDTRLARIVRDGRVELQLLQADGRRIVFHRDAALERLLRRETDDADEADEAGTPVREPAATGDPAPVVPMAPTASDPAPAGVSTAGGRQSLPGQRVRRYRARTIGDGLLDETLVHGQPIGFVWRWPHGQVLRFDREGRLESITSADLDRIDLHRDGRGRLIEARDRSGRAFGFEYDARRLVAVRLPDGQRIRYGYDAHRQLVRVDYPDGRRQQYEYADARAFHWLTGVIDTDGRRSEYRYDDSGRVVLSRGIGETAAQALHFSWKLPARADDSGRTTIRVGSSTTHYRWRHAQGVPLLLSSEGDGCRRCPPVGLSIRAGVAGRVTAIGDLRIRHDALGRVVERRVKARAGNPAWYERFTYSDGSPWPLPISIVRSSVVAGRETQTGIRYNERHQIVRMDFAGWVPEETGPQPIRAGLEFRYAWLTRTDEERAIFGRLATVYRIGADGSRRRYGFRHDGLRRLVSLEPVVTIVHRIERDALGRVTVEHLPDGTIRRRIYDASWRTARSSIRGVEASFSYDAAGRPRAIEWSGGERWSLHLTGTGIDIESNQGWHESIAPGGAPADAAPPGAASALPLALAHEQAGKRTLVDLVGQRYQWWYDDLGRLVQTDSPQEGRKRIRHDAGGRLASITWADGSIDVREHDSFGRLERRTWRAGDEQVETRFTWIGSRLSAMTQRGHRTMSRLDREGRLIETLETRGEHEYNERFGFDAEGRLAHVRLADGTRLRYRHDPAGRRIALDLALAGSGQYRPLVQRESGAAKGALRWRLGNGIRFERRDDARGRPLALVWERADGDRADPAASGLPYRRLQWDRAGVPLVIEHEWGEDRYASDRFGRLIVRERHRRADGVADAGPAVHAEYFALDPLGRRLATHHRDGRDTRLPAVPELDARGLPRAHDGIALRYGAQRRIVAARTKEVSAHYRYDGFGRRIEKEILRNGQAEVRRTKTGFLYRDQRLVAELDGDGKIVRQYVYWEGIPLVVLDHDAAGTTITWLLTDHLGTPIAATDEAARVVWRGDADAFGAIAAQAGGFRQPLRLPGQYFDAETGWHDNLLRTYDPLAGRYLEPDPLGLRAGLDAFVYADGNPLAATDPLGLLLFAFDGTGNGPTSVRGEDISNVRKFFEASADPDKWYMAGVGRDDEASGIKATQFDWATGETARPRVDWMLARLDEALDASWIGRVAPVDVIGFSRGAAMARDFVNRVSRMIDDGVYFGRGICVDLRFLGLWDTVAQFGVLGSENDRWVLSIPTAVRSTWHAVALNEHRSFFPLESALGTSAWVIERGFIGSHADIGGGNAGGDLSDVALVWMIRAAQAMGLPVPDPAPEFMAVTDARLHDRNPFGIDDRLVRERDERGLLRRQSWQRTAPIAGLDWQASQAMISRFLWNRPDASGWPTLAGHVDLQAYGEWLTRVYGIEVRAPELREAQPMP